MKSSFIFAKALLLVAALAAFPKASACGWDATDNYYLFYAFHGDRTNRAVIRSQLTEWWTKYAGKVITTADLDDLSEVETDKMQASANPIVRAAYRKGDRAMQQYLRLLCEYLSYASSEPLNEWDYPSADELAAQRRFMTDFSARVARVQPGQLAPQYTLLRIRALFQQERWQDVVKVWQQSGKPLPQSVFKDMAAGFYAGALRKLGSDEDAAEIYATLGDLHSATWCVHDGRNMGTIRRLYKQNPNSQAVRLLVQDFVNNAQETLDNAAGFGRLGHDGYITKVYTDEVRQFVALAEQAAVNPHVEDVCFWLTAAAWSTYLYGNKQEGKELIDRAMQARGSEEMREDARAIRIVIYSGALEDIEAFDRFVLPELQWLSRSVTYSEDNGFNYLFNASQRIYRQHLAPLYRAHNRETDALLCIAEAEKFYSMAGGEQLEPYQVLYQWNYVSGLLEEDAASLKKIYTDLFLSERKPLRDWLYSELHPAMKQTDLYADLIGTRLMKEGDFRSAEPWLQKVSLEFLSAQPISYYMARRDYNRERWIETRQTLPEVRDGFGGEVVTRLSENQKLNYCRDVMATEEQLKRAATDVERAGAHYALASLLFQGSSLGDCWYLTQYYRSCDERAMLLDTLAYQHLCYAADLSAGKNIDLHTRTLMAKAFINLDSGWNDGWYSFYTYNYDWKAERYTLEFNPDPSRQQSRDFMALVKHVRTLPANYRPDFLTKCDVLTTWMARNP